MAPTAYGQALNTGASESEVVIVDRLVDAGKILGIIGGAAWTVKSGLIILMNSNFQPIEGVLYFIGVGGIFLGAIGLGALVARRWTGAAQWIGLIIVAVVALVLTGVISSYAQTGVAAWYAAGNVGIEEEMGILTSGLIWLVLGIYMLMATRSRSESAT